MGAFRELEGVGEAIRPEDRQKRQEGLLQMDYGSSGYYSDPKGHPSYLNVCRANDFATLRARCCPCYNYMPVALFFLVK